MKVTKEFREYIDPRNTEYRLQPALATAIYYAHCARDRRQAMPLHEDRSGSVPDIALLGRDGRLWLYEVKRNTMTRPAAAQVLCQLLCYASKYKMLSPEELAKLYCDYKKRLGYLFYYPDVLQKRYEESDKLSVLKEEFEAWFGISSNTLGGEVARLVFLAPAWENDAMSLIEQVRSDGIEASAEVLRRHATGRTPSKWITDAVARAKDLESIRKADWTLATFRDPATWIEETRTLPAV